MTNKERYQLFVEKEKNIPIFSKPWWMDVVCGAENWDVYLVGNGNDIRAAFIYYINENNYGKSISRPILTQNNGIYIKYPENQKMVAKFSYEEKIINEVCEYIESLGLVSYEQQYHYSFSYWLPFFWRYYKETTRYTFVVDTDRSYEEIRNNYSAKIRNELKKGEKHLKVESTEDIELFYRINKMSFDRQGVMIPYSYELFKNLYLSCKENKSGVLLCVRDENKRIHSVAMLVWDEHSVYYLLNGTDPDLKMFQGNLVLIDYGIKFAKEMNKKFDFEGSVIKNVNHVFREFGGQPMPYFRIEKRFNL